MEKIMDHSLTLKNESATWNVAFDFSFNRFYIYILNSFNKEEALA